MVLVGLAPYGLTLRLYAAHCAECRNRTVQHPQRAFHLDREVDVARSVYQVDLIGLAVVVPESGGSGRGDSDTPLLLLDHPVHSGGTVVNLADLVSLPRIIEDTLARRGLAGVDMGHDADVSGICQVSCHLTVENGEIRNGSGQMPCWPLPSCAYLLSSYMQHLRNCMLQLFLHTTFLPWNGRNVYGRRESYSSY